MKTVNNFAKIAAATTAFALLGLGATNAAVANNTANNPNDPNRNRNDDPRYTIARTAPRNNPAPPYSNVLRNSEDEPTAELTNVGFDTVTAAATATGTAAYERRVRAAGSLVVGGFNQNERHRGNGRYTVVGGSGNHVLILGSASVLRVTGDNNEIRVYNVGRIEVTGRNNQVYYVNGPQATGNNIVNTGSNNDIRQDPGAV